MKDLFSGHSKIYAAFRPDYPEAVYQHIMRHVKHKAIAWDCATGNGQVARALAHYFERVEATDISQQQLDNAYPSANIYYKVSAAEQTPFHDHQFDLITVAQALHWFDRDKFYKEVKRVGKPGGILAVWGYALLYIEPAIDDIITNFYSNTVGPFWDDARRLVEQEYKTIEFPFPEITTPKFSIDVTWSLEHLAGYLESWSATQKYIHKHQANPVSAVVESLRKHWEPAEIKTVSFPVFMRMGVI
ncbi:class I SAM-dependent methyltransferase [Ohtaekwangia sp.]|uniref:class I SAM-dependent methyltransferase n=1 Tax=Ohtaekwangia sp. TaxID=2066019 RepID=UPI002FDCD820